MFEAVAAAATYATIEGAAVDMLEADGYPLGTHPVWVLMIIGLLLARAGLSRNGPGGVVFARIAQWEVRGCR
jgi:hypothetical protein